MASAFTCAAFLHHGSNSRTSSSSHIAAHGSPRNSAGIEAILCFRSPCSMASIDQFRAFCTRNSNAGIPSRSSPLQISQMFGERLRRSSRFSILLPHGSQAIHSAASSVPGVHLRALDRTVGSYCLLCAKRGPARPSRCGSSLFQDQLHGRRGQSKVGKPGCVGNSAAAGAMTLKPLLDQVLLMGTVLGVYIAGVASLPRLPQLFPDDGVSSSRQDSPRSHRSVKRKPIQQQKPSPESPEYAGEDGWSQLQSKLFQAVSMESADAEEEMIVKSPMLGLQAVARVPRLHLLLTTLQHLRKEVEAISDTEQSLDLAKWQELSMSVLSRSVPPVCKDWILQEVSLTKQPADGSETELALGESSNSIEMSVLDNMMDILKVSESIPSYLARSGKADLYADLIFFLRFGSVRLRGCCDHRVFKKHTGKVLEDMVVAVAEVVATLFLDCSSTASLSPHGEMWQTLLLPSILSSRSLERFRNEVAMYGWLNQNFTSVAAIFEDRFDLWTLKRRPVPHQGKKRDRKPVKTAMEMESNDLVLTLTQLPARRSTELKALTGWRYSYSLCLEVSDVLGPLMSILVSKLGEGLSFLLVTLIGRSLGLIYQGIRQSLRWPSNRKGSKSQ